MSDPAADAAFRRGLLEGGAIVFKAVMEHESNTGRGEALYADLQRVAEDALAQPIIVQDPDEQPLWEHLINEAFHDFDARTSGTAPFTFPADVQHAFKKAVRSMLAKKLPAPDSENMRLREALGEVAGAIGANPMGATDQLNTLLTVPGLVRAWAAAKALPAFDDHHGEGCGYCHDRGFNRVPGGGTATCEACRPMREAWARGENCTPPADITRHETHPRTAILHFPRRPSDADLQRILAVLRASPMTCTPAAQWRENGEPDPHGNRYDGERAQLALGHLSDDELANEVFLNGDRRLTVRDLMAGVLPAIAYLQAGKDRIRWLSRALVRTQFALRTLYEETADYIRLNNLGDVHHNRSMQVARDALAATGGSLQERVEPWLLACFGPEISADTVERNHRFLEESLELVQACGCTASEAHQLVDYTFGRPVGEKRQEAGGVMITLAALCRAQGIDMHAEGERELARIWTMVDKIRAKQAAKPKHSPLPGPMGCTA